MPQISPNAWPTVVLCLYFAADSLLESTDPALSGWSRLAVRTVTDVTTILLLQMRGLELPLPRLRLPQAVRAR